MPLSPRMLRAVLVLAVAMPVAASAQDVEPVDGAAVASAAVEPVAASSQAVTEPRILDVPDAAPQAIAALSQPRILGGGTGEYYDDGGDEEELTDEGMAQRDLLLREFPDHLVESMWIQDWSDLERAYQYGRLVDVPSDPDGRGIVLRLEGSSRIGELVNDAYRQTLLCRLTKPAAGLLYRIASRLRQMEGEAYVPLEITSMVRTWDYQLRLTDVNPNADRSREGVPPTHVLGMAFDIARSRMSDGRQRRLETILHQLAGKGELSYYKEGSSNGLKHYHVMALPSADAALARDFDIETQVAGGEGDALASHRGLPDPPCVTFGSSLEPFSAICSCEAPLELSAAAAAAPISR